MWASDSSITIAMSRLDLRDNLPLHYNPRLDNNNHLSLHHLAVKAGVAANNKNNNNNNNNSNNNNNIIRDQHHSSLGSLNQPSRLVLPRSADLPKIQLPRVQPLAQSVPSTPLSTKHVTASSYADYENYLFI